MQRWGNENYDWAKQRVYRTSEKDKEVFTIVFDVPKLSGAMPWICLILNLFLPGVGTMLAACLGSSHAWSKTQLTIGLF